jgi:hypothetical protein
MTFLKYSNPCGKELLKIHPTEIGNYVMNYMLLSRWKEGSDFEYEDVEEIDKYNFLAEAYDRDKRKRYDEDDPTTISHFS